MLFSSPKATSEKHYHPEFPAFRYGDIVICSSKISDLDNQGTKAASHNILYHIPCCTIAL